MKNLYPTFIEVHYLFQRYQCLWKTFKVWLLRKWFVISINVLALSDNNIILNLAAFNLSITFLKRFILTFYNAMIKLIAPWKWDFEADAFFWRILNAFEIFLFCFVDSNWINCFNTNFFWIDLTWHFLMKWSKASFKNFLLSLAKDLLMFLARRWLLSFMKVFCDLFFILFWRSSKKRIDFKLYYYITFCFSYSLAMRHYKTAFSFFWWSEFTMKANLSRASFISSSFCSLILFSIKAKSSGEICWCIRNFSAASL